MKFSIKSLFVAFRLKTLVAAFIPVLIATSLAASMGLFFNWWPSLFALGGAICIQIATNLFNDAIDFRKGADDEKRIGPKRVTQSGLISEKWVWGLACTFLLLACGFGIPIVLRGGVPFVIFGLVSLFLAYGYTGGPFPLAYLGLGDLFVVLFFGLFAVGGTFYLQALDISIEAIVSGLQVGFLATILIAINNLRDSKNDVKAGKKTLAVRFGDQFVRFEILLLILSTYLLNFYYLSSNQNSFVFISYLALPLALYINYLVFTLEDKARLNKVLGLAALHQVLFGVLLSLGLLVGSGVI